MSMKAPSKRSLAVVVAIVLAAVAALAIFNYIQGVEAEVRAEMDAVEAFVARDAIPAGLSASEAISQGLITREAIPRRNVADGAITSLAQIDGTVATVSIAKGEQILQSRFGAIQEMSGLREIPEDRQAMSLEVTVPPGVAGFVRPGDRVSVIAELETAQGVGTEDGETTQTLRTQFLIQAVEVLAVGQRVVVTQGGESETEVRQSEERILLTLSVTPVEAEKLAFAIFQGRLWLTLLPPDQEPAQTPGRTRANAFD